MLNVCLGQSGLKNWTAGACRGFVVLIKFEAALAPDSAAAGGPAETDISMLYLFLLNYCLDKKTTTLRANQTDFRECANEKDVTRRGGLHQFFSGAPGEGAERGAISLCRRPAFN